MKGRIGVLVVLAGVLTLAGFAVAGDFDLERDLQRDLVKSYYIVVNAKQKMQMGASIDQDLEHLRSRAEMITASHLLLKNRFASREEKVDNLGPDAGDRHRQMVSHYLEIIEKYLSLINDLPLSGEPVSASILDDLEELLKQILPKQKSFIYGNLPYRNLNYPPREPPDSPSIVPAYKGGDDTVSDADLQSTLEAPLTDAIAELAQSLGWNPVSIYEYVKNSIETEWYWGSMKGAEETLRQGSGNDCDQSSLLVALLRASGYPTRYVRGTIEFFPNLDKVRNLTGIEDPEGIASFFQKAGIPYRPVVSAGKITNFQVEHIWVESLIPFANFHGAVVDEHGKAWIALDTSIKAAGYTYNDPDDIFDAFDIAEIRDSYLSTFRSETPLDYLRTRIEDWLEQNEPGISYDNLLLQEQLNPEVMNLLPASLQFKQINITHEYNEIPEELQHRVRFQATAPSGTVLYDTAVEALILSNRQIELSYEPETVEDQEIINTYGGLANTPAYLVKLRPSLTLDGDNLAVGQDGLPIGALYECTIELISPGGTEKITNTHISGNFGVIGVVAQQAVIPQPMPIEEKDARRLLYEEAISYIDRWNYAENEIASLLNVAVARPIPAVVTLGGVFDVTYLLGTPHGMEWKGVYVDADLRAVDPVARTTDTDGLDRIKAFMQLSSLEGSVLENKILEDDFEVEAISTAKLFQLANDQGVPILELDENNASDVLPTLLFAEEIKEDISDAINQGFVVNIPQTEISYENWIGIGYLKEDSQTGASGWMLNGNIAGGMTVGSWPEQLSARIISAYQKPPNSNPNDAAHIYMMPHTNRQNGTVGEVLQKNLEVLVTDYKGHPVKDARVTFSTRAGGGEFTKGNIVKTNYRGIASVELKLGRYTDDNPTYVEVKNKWAEQQVGVNIIDASLESGARIKEPFVAYAYPKEPFSIQKLGGDSVGRILTFRSFVSVKIVDHYGNPIANEQVDFTFLETNPLSVCLNPSQDIRPALFIDRQDPCIFEGGAPTYGQCDSATAQLSDITNIFGKASAHIVLGGVPDAEYPVLVTSNNLSSELFILKSEPFGHCMDLKAEPSTELHLTYVKASDSFGNSIDAVPAGTDIAFKVKLFALIESEKAVPDCIGECTKIVGGRSYEAVVDLDNAEVSIQDQPCKYLNDGIYECEYTVAEGENLIKVDGKATVTRQKSFNDCSKTPPICVEGGTETNNFEDSTDVKIAGVKINVTPEDTSCVLVDDFGYLKKDLTINYRIDPPTYQADTARSVIWKDNYNDIVIFTGTSGQSGIKLLKGYYFDPGSDYSMQVVLNYGRYADFGPVEVWSEEVPLKFYQTEITKIYIEDAANNLPILPGKSATAKADTFPPKRTVIWSIIDKQDKVLADIHPNTGVITAGRDTEYGWITIRATDAEEKCSIKDAKVFIGCNPCGKFAEGLCNLLPGGGIVQLSSVDVQIGIGRTEGGNSAGELFLKSDKPDPDLYNPRRLFFSSLDPNIETRRDSDGSIRQILAPETFVDIVVVDENSYNINFYRPEDISGESSDLYTVESEAQPFKSWKIENPDPSSENHNRLTVTEINAEQNRISEYLWDEELDSWTLSTGNGLQVSTQAEQQAGSDRIVTKSVKDNAGQVATHTQTTYRTFDWGEEIIEIIEDPEGAALTTTYTYYVEESETGSYGRIMSRIDPDGSWIRYEYDELGRTTAEISSWLDMPADTPAGSARTIYFDYTPVDPDDPGDEKDLWVARTITETIQGVVVSKAYNAVLHDSSGGRIEITEECVEQAAFYGHPSNLRTETEYFASESGLAQSGRIKRIQYPDGRLDTYSYDYGTYSPGSSADQPGVFEISEDNTLRKILTHATIAQPAGIAYKSTREVTIDGYLGENLQQETYVYIGSGYDRVSWVARQFDEFGRIEAVYNSNGAQSETVWSCCTKDSETGTDGIQRSFTYDDLQRVETATQTGVAAGQWPAQPDVLTSYTYDADGRVLTETVVAGELSLSQNSVYDKAGRKKSSTDPNQLTTSYEYEAGGRITTIVHPGGATEITTHYLDGNVKSVTGTAVIPKYYEYGVNADGTRWTSIYTSRPDSPRWEKTTADLLGRTIRTEIPGYIGVETAANYYNAQGQLYKTTVTGQADTLFEYNELGEQIRSGLDVDRNGVLENISNDHINETETIFEKLGGDWWLENSQRVYAKAQNDTTTTVSTSRVRLTGWSGQKTEEAVAIDIHGNMVTTWAEIDRQSKTITRFTDLPNSDIDAVNITLNGLLVSSKSATGITSTFAYDALGRQTVVIHPRTGTTITHYNDLNQVDYIKDPAGHRTEFSYYPDTGFKLSETNAAGKSTRFIYNDRGQVTYTWGDVPYPVRNVYDEYGQLYQSFTYRGGTNWNLAVWPEGHTGTADINTWHYQESTGLLDAKEDADGKQVSYSYASGGRLYTRTWARKIGTDSLLTTYTYDPDTAELTNIDYSDVIYI